MKKLINFVQYHWGDLDVDGWIILGWISRRWDVGIRTGLGWTRIETGGGSEGDKKGSEVKGSEL